LGIVVTVIVGLIIWVIQSLAFREITIMLDIILHRGSNRYAGRYMFLSKGSIIRRAKNISRHSIGYANPMV
jgi:hypothetical protein